MLLRGLTDQAGYAFVQRGEGLVGNGVRDRLEPPVGADRFSAATGWVREVLRPDDVAFAAFSFDPASEGSAVVVPEQVLTVGGGAPDRGAQLVEVIDRVRYAGSSVDEVRWMESVAAAARAIRDGDYDKVVLARDLHVWAEAPLNPVALAERLASRFPGCMTFVHEGFVGATPELLIRREGRQVESVVLAGTTTPDEAAGRALLASEKDRVEHRLARDSAVASLAPFCGAELQVDAEPWLMRLDNLQHLATRIRGTLAADTHVLELVDALHPTAAVGGSPSDVALPLIGQLEGMDRARYAGPIGIVRGDGDGTFGIALRCAQLAGNRARLFAGAGIVGASLPEAELEETRLKLTAMQSVMSSS